MNVEFPVKFNMSDYFLYHNLEEGRADKTCLYYEDRSWTYGQAAAWSNMTGNALRELGLRIEERVLIALPDCPEFVWTWFGISRVGGVITMVNPLLPASDYEYYLEYTRATIAVIDESLVDAFLQCAKTVRHLKHVLVVGDNQFDARNSAIGLRSFEKTISQMPTECQQANTTRDDIAIWLFSSGSTGKPKAAVHLHHDLPYNTECYAKRVLGVGEDDLTVAVPKLFFGYATGTNLLFPFAVGGATALFSERSTPERMFDSIEQYRPTILTSVPTMINSMLNLDGSETRDLSSLRKCLSAGEALPPELYERWIEKTGVEILDGIGSAEMFHIYITNRPGDVKPGSLGRIVDGYKARIVSGDGTEVSVGEMGTLMIHGDSAALCYWQSHEQSKATFAGDWCTTGDQFHVDEQGYYWYHGRTDEMLKVSGIFVAPAEIENCLLQHEAVLECAVVGHDSGDGLIKPMAFIVTNDRYAADEVLARQIQKFVKQRLAPYKYPRWVEFVTSLPKNDRGKIDRKQLRQSNTREDRSR